MGSRTRSKGLKFDGIGWVCRESGPTPKFPHPPRVMIIRDRGVIANKHRRKHGRPRKDYQNRR